MMSDPNKVFFPNLEGLRFFAFFLVFVNHATGSLGFYINTPTYAYMKSHIFKNGDLGVSFFFVLSGFLITYLLLKEKEMSGKINIKNFYLRRVLRIWPLYYLIIFLCLVVFPHLSSIIPEWFPIEVSVSKLNPWYYMTFTGNFDYLANGIPRGMIGVLWSVSVEEQFYLFWPLIIAFIPRKHLLKTFIIIILGSIAFRFFCSNGGSAMIIKYHSLSCISDLATGAVIAYLACKESFIEKISRIPKYAIILVYLVLIVIAPLRFEIWHFGSHYKHVASIMPVIFSSLFAFIILEQNYAKNSFYKISNFKLISSFGKFTYGMYCYHMISFFVVLFIFHLMGIKLVGMDVPTFFFIVFTSFFSTVLISELSYAYFESFFLRMKDKFALIRKD
jgi:peptidoglycan/LPS O-acetylase OafA/YrhL